jgi:lon-related putative ATP-dependent protease
MSDIEKFKLKVEQLTNTCVSECTNFDDTRLIEPLSGIMGQDRAVAAIKFGISMNRRGYNIYVAGGWGSGRNSYVKEITYERAKKEKVPKDWMYVNNFKNIRTPIALGLDAGKGKEFIKDMEFIVDFLKKEVANVFSSKDYENSRAVIIKEYHDSMDGVIVELNKIGEKFGFKFGQNDRGLISIPLKDGEPMSEDDYRNLSEDEYEKLMESSSKLSIETLEFFNMLRKAEEEFRAKVKSLDDQMGRRVVDLHLMSLRDKYSDNPSIIGYLDALTEDIVEHLEKFKGEKDTEAPSPMAIFGQRSRESFFDRYKVNLFIDNSKVEHAPVVFASNPTYSNLCGTIEYKNELGILKTDFTQIKPGAIHEANGGYLIILAKDILMMPYAWRGLKRAMLESEITIEPTGLYSGAIISSTLKPQAIPLDVKVVIIGDAYTYQLLYYYDEEFRKLFKVMADFEYEMDRNDNNMSKVIQFIAKHVKEDQLRHFTGDAVRRIMQYSSRTVDDQRKLSTHLTHLVDILHESDKYAEDDSVEYVDSKHVQMAIDGIMQRNSKYEEAIMELFKDGDYLIDVDGKKVGEINGLAVVGTGQYSFGKPSKITASTYQGRAGIINIEREARTSGSIHDKGVMILTGYLGYKYAQDKPLALSASIVFEQLYSGVEGDSASSTELYAILSSLANMPINQNFAVTGSVNQRGEIQPIGGVNEKIEGFFKVCKMKGITGTQGVMIPHQNVKNLVLNDEVIDAVREGKFHIYSVETVDQGIEILTGIEAGIPDKDGKYPKGTIHYLVDEKLKALATKSDKNDDDKHGGNKGHGHKKCGHHKKHHSANGDDSIVE